MVFSLKWQIGKGKKIEEKFQKMGGECKHAGSVLRFNGKSNQNPLGLHWGTHPPNLFRLSLLPFFASISPLFARPWFPSPPHCGNQNGPGGGGDDGDEYSREPVRCASRGGGAPRVVVLAAS